MVRWKVVSPEVAKCAGMRDPLVDGHDVLLQLSRVACLVAADLEKDFFNVIIIIIGCHVFLTRLIQRDREREGGESRAVCSGH